MAESTTFSMRLKVHIGTCLSSDDQSLTVKVRKDKNLKIKSNDFGNPPLSEANWLVFESDGFKTEDEGREFGEVLRQALHLTGLCCRIGLDARGAGDDRQLSHIGEEFFATIYPDSQLLPDLHGLTVFPDNGNWKEPFQVRANLGGERSSDSFINVLKEIISQSSKTPSTLDSLQRAIRVMNLADASNHPIAKLALSVSVVEGLATEPKWTKEQKHLIMQIVKWINNSCDSVEGAEIVANAIKGIGSRVPIRQRIRSLLDSNDLSDLFEQWNDIYEARSRVFHGDSSNSDQIDCLEESELCDLGENAFRLCAQIILTIANRQGMVIPRRAATNFNVKIT